MKKCFIFCDICEDEESLAVAEYIDKSGDKQDVCEEHLEIVKELKLKWLRFPLKTIH